MLPYPRELSKPLTGEEMASYFMTITPYKVDTNSNTDSSGYNNNSKNINGAYRYAAFTSLTADEYTALFSKTSIDFMSAQITARLDGVHPEGKSIIVPDDTILSVADSIWNYGYLTLGLIQEQVIMFIVETVKNDFEMIQQNDRLSTWVQKYDISTGLKQFNGIKLNEKKHAPFYHWTY
jgi:hypothetical protein